MKNENFSYLESMTVSVYTNKRRIKSVRDTPNWLSLVPTDSNSSSIMAVARLSANRIGIISLQFVQSRSFFSPAERLLSHFCLARRLCSTNRGVFPKVRFKNHFLFPSSAVQEGNEILLKVCRSPGPASKKSEPGHVATLKSSLGPALPALVPMQPSMICPKSVVHV